MHTVTLDSFAGVLLCHTAQVIGGLVNSSVTDKFDMTYQEKRMSFKFEWQKDNRNTKCDIILHLLLLTNCLFIIVIIDATPPIGLPS